MQKRTTEKSSLLSSLFRKNDVLEINIISAAMLAAVYLSLLEKPEVNRVERYYAAAS